MSSFKWLISSEWNYVQIYATNLSNLVEICEIAPTLFRAVCKRKTWIAWNSSINTLLVCSLCYWQYQIDPINCTTASTVNIGQGQIRRPNRMKGILDETITEEENIAMNQQIFSLPLAQEPI